MSSLSSPSAPSSSARRPSFVRRLVVAATFALVTGPAAAVITGGVAEATRLKSSSGEVATAAAAALDSLERWNASGDPVAYIGYLGARDEVAEMAAHELQIDPDELAAAWRAAHPTKQVAVLGALSQLGVPYRSMMSKEGVGFDCSGLTTYAWARAGVELTRSSGDQIRESTPVDRADAEAGDLVYYPGHVSMYLGVTNAIVHSPNSGNHVEITFVSDRRVDTVRYGDPLD